MTQRTYNVTFIAPYWHMTTTLTTTAEGARIIGEADDLIADHSGFRPANYATVDIDVEYVGEDA